MKKIVKFSGTEKDDTAYFTGIFVPKSKEVIEELFKLTSSRVQLGDVRVEIEEKERVFREKIYSGERFSTIEKCNDGIILRIKYSHGSGRFNDYIEDAKRDANNIAEQIETLIIALEGE